MFLMIDNYDSYVYNLVRYFEELGEEVIIYRNDKITLDEIKKLKLQGIIISPGPKTPRDAGISLSIIDEFKGIIPILGICLGHQVIAEYFGGNIIRGKVPSHGKISEIFHNGKGTFIDLKNPFKATRYHSLIVERASLPEEIIVTAETKDGDIMGLRHREYFVEGVQFHPEAELTEQGHKLLKNFIEEAKNASYFR